MTSYRLGPTLFLPSSTVWQALHLLNTFSPLAASPAARAGPARAAAAAKVAIVRALLTRISLSGSVDLPGTAILFCAGPAGRRLEIRGGKGAKATLPGLAIGTSDKLPRRCAAKAGCRAPRPHAGAETT